MRGPEHWFPYPVFAQLVEDQREPAIEVVAGNETERDRLRSVPVRALSFWVSMVEDGIAGERVMFVPNYATFMPPAGPIEVYQLAYEFDLDNLSAVPGYAGDPITDCKAYLLRTLVHEYRHALGDELGERNGVPMDHVAGAQRPSSNTWLDPDEEFSLLADGAVVTLPSITSGSASDSASA